MKKYFNTMYKPVIVLVIICIVISLALSVTNAITLPIIKETERKAANAGRLVLLPTATDFEKIEVTADGIVDFYKATNDVGYVITAKAKGYGGDVTVMVGFSEKGDIAAINVMENSETPGLGKRVEEDAFKDQFKGLKAETYASSDVTAIAGATISSGAVTSAVNSAVKLYNEKVKGVVEVVLTTEEKIAQMLPQSGIFTKTEVTNLPEKTVEITAEGKTETYAIKADEYWLAENGDVVVLASAEGYHKNPLSALVGFGADGTIIAINIDGSQQTEGLGTKVGEVEFGAQFIQKKIPLEGVDMVASATVSSTAAVEAVNIAGECFLQNAVATDGNENGGDSSEQQA